MHIIEIQLNIKTAQKPHNFSLILFAYKLILQKNELTYCNMKHIILLFMFIVSASSFAMKGFKQGIQCFLYVVQPEVKNEKPEDPISKRRTPLVPLECVISEEYGVQFISGLKPNILYFEIMDEYETVISYADESTFIDALFSMNGEITIILVASDKEYIGYVNL